MIHYKLLVPQKISSHSFEYDFQALRVKKIG